jgi:AcrR family transcriptional regulator
MVINMDRRQRKTREAIFNALIALLSKKDFGQITVGEIIQQADIGRATFYAHFETKDDLLKALSEDLFCHIFDAMDGEDHRHQHIFDCEPPGSVFLHLFQHLKRNDNHILRLLSCPSSELFAQYFKSGLYRLIENQLPLFAARKSEKLPESFWIHHIASTFVETVRWWIENGMEQTPETVTEYFLLAV